MIFIFILVALLVGITAGGYVVRRRSIAYKKRWQEALDLVKRLNDGETPQLEPPTNKWQLQVKYVRQGLSDYAKFYAVRGKERVPVGSQYDPALYQDQFERQTKHAKNAVQAMNKAECT